MVIYFEKAFRVYPCNGYNVPHFPSESFNNVNTEEHTVQVFQPGPDWEALLGLLSSVDYEIVPSHVSKHNL